jgi:hypothetical protein
VWLVGVSMVFWETLSMAKQPNVEVVCLDEKGSPGRVHKISRAAAPRFRGTENRVSEDRSSDYQKNEDDWRELTPNTPTENRSRRYGNPT